MKTWDDISYIVRNKNRKAVFEALVAPKIPTELSRELKINRGFVSNLLIELLERKMIVCLSPNEKRYRFYGLTTKGKNLLKRMKKLNYAS